MPDAQLRVRVAHARKTVAVEVALNGHPSHGIELTLDKLDKLISELGDARSQMVAELPRETFEREDVRISAVANTTWCIKASPPMGALLAFDHPKFGPVGFTLPRDQIAKIVSFLTHRFLVQPTASAEKH